MPSRKSALYEKIARVGFFFVKKWRNFLEIFLLINFNVNLL